MNNEDNNVKLATKVEEMSTQLTKLVTQFQSLNTGTIIPTNTTKTLQRYLHSANEVITSAASVVSSRSTVHGGSETSGEQLLAQSKRERINKWLLEPVIEERELLVQSPNSILGSEDAPTDYTASDKPLRTRPGYYDDNETRPSSLEDPSVGKFDLETTVIDNLLKMAHLKFARREYNDSRNLLEKFKQKSTDKYGSLTAFPNRDETLELMAMCYIHLGVWMSAEQVLQEQFEGRDNILETLLGRYIHHRNFCEARNLILNERKSRQGSPTLRGSRELKEKEILLSHLLAEAALGLGEFEVAKAECRRAAMEKVALWGSDDVGYHMSISLLAEIYEASGDSTEAQIYRDMVPDGIEGD
jgi:hypothetical protein